MKEGRREWQGKSLNDVDIRDDFMFSYIMRDPELCLGLLRQLLPDCPIERIEYVELEAEKQQLEKALGTRLETQKVLFGAAGKRSVRLDAYLDDGKTIYNIEMQTAEQIQAGIQKQAADAEALRQRLGTEYQKEVTK